MILLRAYNLAKHAPSLLFQNIETHSVSSDDMCVLIEALGITERCETSMRLLLAFLKSEKAEFVDSSMCALRILFVNDRSSLSSDIKNALISISVSFSELSVRITAANCLADFTFLET